MFLSTRAPTLTVAEGVSLEQVARAVLLGQQHATGPRTVQVQHHGALVCVVAVEPTHTRMAAVLDDRAEAFDGDHAGAWRRWLRLSNSVALCDWPAAITTVSQITPPDGLVTAPPAPRPTRPVQRPEGAWGLAYDEAGGISSAEQDLVASLAAHSDLQPPAIGTESPEGIMMDISWPEFRVVVACDHLTQHDRQDLAAADWRIVDPDPEAVAAALRGAA
jgi:hypothetical protein